MRFQKEFLFQTERYILNYTVFLKMQKIRTYSLDKRKPIEELYDSYAGLAKKGWLSEIIYLQPDEVSGQKISLPILCYRTPKKGKALWLIAGIHGEEPAGANAIAENIAYLHTLKNKGIPVVIFPLCNPKGYRKNWRYPMRKKISHNYKLNLSVGSAIHVLPSRENFKKPRRNKPECFESKAIILYILKIFPQYLPRLVIDLHEDESIIAPYVYSQGMLGADDPVAREITKIIGRKFLLKNAGKTQFGEFIREGIISWTRDSSIDEFLAADKIIVKGKNINGPAAKTVVVAETPIPEISLKRRVAVHGDIIKSLNKFWKMVR